MSAPTAGTAAGGSPPLDPADRRRPGARGRWSCCSSASGVADRSRRLDPDNPDPDGARAVAQVLDDQGVDVTVVRSADALDDAAADADTTVLVTSTDLLGQSTIDRLLGDAATRDLVLAAARARAPPRPSGSPRCPTGSRSTTRGPATCADPTYDGLSIAVDLALEYPVDRGCFRGDARRPARPARARASSCSAPATR